MKKTIGIIGYGFVGKAVAQLSEIADVEIYDPNIEEYKNNYNAFVQDFVFVCVPTPTDEEGHVDTSIVDESVLTWWMLRADNLDSILVIKSTISVGTTDFLKQKFETDRIVHNPEFLTQRTAMEDFRNPTEVIVGGETSIAAEVVKFYKSYYPVQNSDIKYYIVSSEKAELVKTVRNSYYAVKVSFFNEVYELCEKMGIDYASFRDVFTLGGEHPWIAKQHTMVPGPDKKLGYGGACLPKDSEGLYNFAKQNGVNMSVLGSAIDSNKRRRDD